MENKIKDYLSYENERNKRYAQLYTNLIRLAYGENNAVLIGHHLTFEQDGRLETENEIPSADTLIFDYEIMSRVFGKRAQSIMVECASRPADARDVYLQNELAKLVQAPPKRAKVPATDCCGDFHERAEWFV